MVDAIKIPKQAQTIIYTGMNEGYLDGRKLLKGKSGYPKHALHDDILTDPERAAERLRLIKEGYNIAYAEELLVTGELKQDADYIIDPIKDLNGRSWRLLLRDLPKDVTEKAVEMQKRGRNAGLFIDPEDFELTGLTVTVSPKLAIPLNIPYSGHVGKVDKLTRLPLNVSFEESRSLSQDQRRRIFYNLSGVRPLVRYYRGSYYGRYGINALSGYGGTLGIGYASPA